MIRTVRGNSAETYNRLVTKEKNPEMMGSEFSILNLKAGETYELLTDGEYVFDLLQGKVAVCWDGCSEIVERNNCFHEDPIVLHVPCSTNVKFTGISETAEISVADTDNDKHFSSKLYRSEDLYGIEEADGQKLDGKLKRIKRIFWNRTTCPETALFCGEVLNYPGCWACYPPHIHVEPEIYYYKFYPEGGYGFSEFGDEAIKVMDRSVTCNPSMQRHSQVTAPGYAGFIMWIQKLADNGKDIEYIMDEQQAWLDKEGVKIFPEL